jgi:hypothetical protein
MNDYFFQLVDARAQLAGAKTIMQGYLQAVANGNEMVAESWLNLMSQEVIDIENLLESSINEAA